jgi:hypothetical protein
MRTSLTSAVATTAVALVGAGMGVAAQHARTEPDAKAAEISTWRWNVDMILLSQRDSSKFSEVFRWVPPAAGDNRKNDF